MKTVDEIQKIKAMILYIIQKTGKIDFIKLFKLMYFAQQKYLVKYGRPIIKDTFCALNLGPVPTFTYKALQCDLGKQEPTNDIKDFMSGISTTNNSGINYVTSSQLPDMDELAEAEIKTIDEVLNDLADKDSKSLSVLSHKDKAWKNARRRSGEDPEKDRISLIDIAKSGGADESTLSYLKEMQLVHKIYQA